MSTRLGSSRFPVPCISYASLPSAGEGTHMPWVLLEDVEAPPFKHETDFKYSVLIDESDHHSIKPTLPRIIVLSFILKWVANYGLKKLRMELSRYIGPSCAHQKSVQGLASAKYCSILPSIEMNVSHGFCCRCFLSPASCPQSAASGTLCRGELHANVRAVASLPAPIHNGDCSRRIGMQMLLLEKSAP